ncbi:MAG: transposase [Alphaproteobacteria bacterium]
MEMTEGASSDHLTGVLLIENCDLLIESVRADTAYDSQPFREACHIKGAKQIIPPLINARLRKSKKKEHPTLWKDRNEAVKIMKSATTSEEGKKQWKEQVQYGKRAKVEGFFHRFKKTFGFYFMSQSEDARRNELVFKLIILNAFNQFPKPVFQKIN